MYFILGLISGSILVLILELIKTWVPIFAIIDFFKNLKNRFK